MKKIFTLALAAALALSLVACGEVDEESNSPASQTAEATDSEQDVEPSDGEQSEEAAPSAEDIRSENNIIDLIDGTGTVALTHTAMNGDGSVYGTYTYDFYKLDNGLPALETMFTSDEVGSTETVVSAGDGYAAAYDIYTGFSKSLTVIPTNRYEEQIDGFWDMIYPIAEGETVNSAAAQDGATVVDTFYIDKEYPESYQRALYYLDESGRIVFKEVTKYLVTEDAEIDPAQPYGIDTAPVMSVDTYSVEYGCERKLNLNTDEQLSEGETCELTVHILDGDYSETQVYNVSKDAIVMVMCGGDVYETYTDEAMTEVFDMSGISEDKAEIWARRIAA